MKILNNAEYIKLSPKERRELLMEYLTHEFKKKTEDELETMVLAICVRASTEHSTLYPSWATKRDKARIARWSADRRHKAHKGVDTGIDTGIDKEDK